MIFSKTILAFLYSIPCFLALNGRYANNNFLSDTNDKTIIFEGSYFDKTSDEMINDFSKNETGDINVSLFIKPSSSMELLLGNRPSKMTNDLDEMNKILMEYRNKVQTETYRNNLIAYSKIRKIFSRCPDAEIKVSKVNPLISVQMDSSFLSKLLMNELNDELNETNSILDEIYIGDRPSVVTFSDLPGTFEKINVDRMIESGVFDGAGINVGIVEAAANKGSLGGVLDVSKYSLNSPGFDDYFERSIKIRPNQTDLSYHADHVAMIAAGNNGIAKGSNILSCYSYGGVDSYADWLVQENMNVGNASFGGIYDYGTYHSQSKLVDSWIKNYLFTFVVAAGNRTYDDNGDVLNDNYISWPATAYNAISVGNSYESTLSLGAGSCYKENDNYHGSKPNLVAPGTTKTNSSQGTGTSYSAPQVTGCIALLMEEFPNLIMNPELVTSIVTSSASPMSSVYNEESGDNRYDGSGLHNQIGSGLLNYEKMREAAKNSISIMRAKDSSAGMISKYIDIVANDTQRIRASSSWLYDPDNFTDYDLELYKLRIDGSMEKVAYINDPYNNVEFIDFDVKTPGTYRLAIRQKEKNTTADFIGLSYVLIDDNGGSASGATNVDNTPNLQLKINNSFYKDYDNVYNNEVINEFVVNDGIHSFETTRKRTRFTDDGKLVLSAKSNDSDSAYMEYLFSKEDDNDGDWGLYNIKYKFGLWSDDESLIRKSSIDLYGKHMGNWELIRHFDPKEMSTNPDRLKTYVDCIGYFVSGLRFIVTTNHTNNSNNVGRVVIGNIEGDIHDHLYKKYKQFDNVYHKTSCACGYYRLDTHTWGPSYWIGTKEYANCIQCRQQRDMNSDGPIVTPIV